MSPANRDTFEATSLEHRAATVEKRNHVSPQRSFDTSASLPVNGANLAAAAIIAYPSPHSGLSRSVIIGDHPARRALLLVYPSSCDPARKPCVCARAQDAIISRFPSESLE